MKVVATNKKAYHDYDIIDKYEAGIELKGSEVKAIREGRVNLKDSYVKIKDGQAYWMQGHISNLDTVYSAFKHEEKRPRKLLLHKSEIAKLAGYTSEKGYTLIPTRLYFNNKNRAKLEVAVAKGRKLHDKRRVMKEKELAKEARAAMKRYGY
ncbi:MAG: SsrA-binding protein SmpB [Epsilonproteobacteria bacterium]|nr:SsrA-binding protein SmpB [Campylobacterota bacterium]